MSYDDPTTEQPVQPAPPAYAGDGRATAPVSVADDGGYLASDEDDEWVSEAPKGLRVRAVTGALLLLLFAASGFWAGAILQKHHDKSTAASTVATLGAAARRAAAAGAGGFGGSAGGLGAGTGPGAGTGSGRTAGATTGIVTDIQGTTLYLTDTAGNLIKVTLTPSSKISKTAAGTAADFQQGQTVTVTGSKAADGSTTASAVTITPATPAATTPAGG